VLAPVLALGLLGACNLDDVVHRIGWFATMRDSRSPRPYAQPIPPPEGAVPVTGAELPVDLDNADARRNPRPTTAESLERGRWVYGTYCLVCHGGEGAGDGPVSQGGGGPFPGVPTLVDADRRRLSDGYYYGIIVDAQTMGKGLMPRYGYRIRGDDRWDLVNYVRLLQARAAQSGAGR
jgi:mono/diheme cytochrome c family protein